MAGRRLPRHPIDTGRRGYPADGPYARPPPPMPRPPHHLEEELDFQTAELRRVMADNRRLAEDRAALLHESTNAKEDIRRLSNALNEARAKEEAHTRELVEKCLKLEADLRATESLRNDLIQLRAEVQKLNGVKQELAAQVQNLSQEATRAKSENQQIPLMKQDLERFRQELMHASAAVEYEKKANVELMEQRQALENNLVSMAREIEKLRADRLATSEVRPWGAGGAYGIKLGSPDGSFPSYGDTYGLHSGVADKGPLYGVGSGSWAGLEKGRLGRR